MKKKVLILAGGYSKEREISIKTGKEVYKSLKKKYNVKLLDPSKGLINELIFLSASFKGKKKKKAQIYEEIERLKNKKIISQPSRVKTGGSTFKNPINSSKLKVWEIIKNSVPAGCEFGDATISHQHFNFLVNKKDAKFNDMIKLINFIKKKVLEKYKIKLNLDIVIAD